MKRLLSAKPLAIAAVVLGGLAAATAAQARSDVVLSIGINQPYNYGYTYPAAPVYVAPQPVYVQPQPYYTTPRVVYDTYPVYVERPRHHRHHQRNWDWDRDGVPNWRDRAPGDPYRY